MSKKESQSTTIATNKKARFDYTINDAYECGIVLVGTEVKSLRKGAVNLKDSHAVVEGNEVWLLNVHIEEYTQGNRNNHRPTRPRKLLLNRREIKKLTGSITSKGMTLVPLSMYFNAKGYVKVELGLASGKKKYEKREAIKERDWKRDQARNLKSGGQE